MLFVAALVFETRGGRGGNFLRAGDMGCFVDGSDVVVLCLRTILVDGEFCAPDEDSS
jgi:hypothetical protein